MQAATVTLFGPLMILLGLGGGVSLPLSVPPQAENALMARVAPEECLLYSTLAGYKAPQADAVSSPERLMADPEIQQFLAKIEPAIVKAAMSGVGDSPEQQSLAKRGLALGKLLLTQAVAVYVESFSMTPDGVDLRGGLLVHAGEQTAPVKAELEKLQEKYLPENVSQVTIAGTAAHRLTLGGPFPEITWGVKGPYLLVGVGAKSLDTMLERAATEPPAWLAKLKADLPISRRSTFHYVNVNQLRQLAISQLGEPTVQSVSGMVGLDNVNALVNTTGLDKQGFVVRNLIALDGPPAGMLSLLADEPLSIDHLNAIPHDAIVAVAARIKLEKLAEQAELVTGATNRRAMDNINRNLAELETLLDFDIRKELLPALGDVWCLYHSPGETGLVPGGTLIGTVRDRAALATMETKLVNLLRQLAEQQGPRDAVRIKSFTFAGQTVYYLLPPEPMPVTFSWCLTEERILLSLSPNPIKSILLRGDDFQSLAERKEVRQLFADDAAPTMLAYHDTKTLIETLYPTFQVTLQAMMGERKLRDLIDPAMLPALTKITRHLDPEVTAVRRTAAGVETLSYSSLPGGVVGASVMVAAPVLGPAMLTAQKSAMRVTAMNNLHTLSIGLVSYSVENGGLPPAYSVDKDGKPLLSWRVHLLPYVDGSRLYEEFHLDEPWDSEHNRKLIPLMPAVYASRGIKTEQGKTHYLTLRGEQTMFPPVQAKNPPRGQFGNAATIFVVEAGPTSAVIWTKPDDLEVDEKNPAAGLFGLRPEGVVAAFGDGHIETISESIDPKMLWKKINRQDRNNR